MAYSGAYDQHNLSLILYGYHLVYIDILLSCIHNVWTTSELPYLHDLSLMHGDTVVGVLGELVEGTGSGSVNQRIRGVEVGHQWSHRLLLPKCHSVVPPHAAPGGAGRGE